MALVAFFDESGHPQDPNVSYFVLSGIVASSDSWWDFDVAWRAMLTKEKLPQIHMYDLANCEGPFEDKAVWTRERRDALMRQCIDLMTTWLKPRAYTSHHWFMGKGGPRPVATADLYFDSYRRVLRHLEEELLKPYPADRHCVFAVHPEVPEQRLRSYFHDWSVDHPRFKGFLPGEPLHMPPLQLADIIAFVIADNLAQRNGLEHFYNEMFHKEFKSRLDSDPF